MKYKKPTYVGHRHEAKKSLGQNFLKSQSTLRVIIAVGEITEKDIVLEIGPGKGALTAKLLEKAGKVIAVEKDQELFSFLQGKFKDEIENKKLELIDGDILGFDVHAYVGHRQYKIIANIPYNITGAILKKFLTIKNKPERMVLMVQKEVAQRIVTHNKKESILSISVKAYGTPKLETKVPARFFSPAPKVDSAILSIKNISGKNFIPGVRHPENLEERFFEIVKAGFAHKRKVLIKNLEIVSKKEASEQIFKDLKIDKKIRAEDISLETWLKITKNI